MERFSLSVVIPAFNEKDRLPDTLNGLLNFFKDPFFEAEIVVSDDGSSDPTFKIAQDFSAIHPMIRAVSLKIHRGKGAALALGVQQASKEWTLLYDADSAIPIEEIRNFLKRIGPDSQVLIGSRDIDGARWVVHQPWLRHKLGRLFVHFRKSLVGLKEIEDTQCGFKLIRTSLAKKIFAGLQTSGFLFDVEILGRSKILGASIQEIGVSWKHVPQSKVRISRELPRILSQLLEIRKSLKTFKKSLEESPG